MCRIGNAPHTKAAAVPIPTPRADVGVGTAAWGGEKYKKKQLLQNKREPYPNTTPIEAGTNTP